MTDNNNNNNDTILDVKEDDESSSKNESSLLNPNNETKTKTKQIKHQRYGSNENINQPGLQRKSTNDSNIERKPSMIRRFSSMLGDNSNNTQQSSNNLSQYLPSQVASAVSNVPFLSKQFSSKNIIKETFYCHICLCNQPIDESFVLTNCEHRFCTECIKNYWQNRIKDGQVFLKCFYPLETQKPCNMEVDESDILALLDEEMSNKYKKFKTNLENPDARQCPYCETTNFGKASNPIIKCLNCYKSYCYYHSKAHDITESCDSYESRMLKENKLTEQLISEECKECPNDKCKFKIYKQSGCNHMKCVKCNTPFCWLCLEIIEDETIPKHYTDTNSKCKGKQFEGMEMGPPPPMWAIIMMACLVCIFGIPAFIIGLILGGLFYPFFYCGGCCLGENNITGKPYFRDVVGNCFVGWLLLILFVVIFIPIMVLTCVYNILRIILPCLPKCPDNSEAERQRPEELLRRARTGSQNGGNLGNTGTNTNTNINTTVDLIVNNNASNANTTTVVTNG